MAETATSIRASSAQGLATIFDANSWIERLRAAGATVTSNEDKSVSVVLPSPLTQESANIIGELRNLPDGLAQVELTAWMRRDADRISWLLGQRDIHLVGCSGAKPDVRLGDTLADFAKWVVHEKLAEECSKELSLLGVCPNVGRA